MPIPTNPQFTRLTNIYTSLALRSDTDNVILELLGAFSLEKLYADPADPETYAALVATLLAHLASIFHIQRLTLPCDSPSHSHAHSHHQPGWSLAYLVSWEVALRSVEFVLTVVVDGREFLWGARALRDTYLAEFLLAALRVLALHPKGRGGNRGVRDRRARFARVHSSLERLFDGYPGQKSFLLVVCKEVTDELRREPDALVLPGRLRYEMPNLSGELYPLPEILSGPYIMTIIPQENYSGDWLAQFLALRDVSHFVVAANIQYAVKREIRDYRLQPASAQTRNAVLQALENMRLPQYLTKGDLVAHLSDIFRVVLPDTPNLVRRHSDNQDEYGWDDAVDSLCAKLSDRQIVSRASDKEVMNSVSSITRNIALLDDPGATFRAPHPKLFAVNCRNCHLIGDTQLRQSGDIKFPADSLKFDPGSIPSAAVPTLHDSVCPLCSESVTLIREVTMARNTWNLLKPLEFTSETISAERHQPSTFLLPPPKAESGMPFQPSATRHDSETISPFDTRPTDISFPFLNPRSKSPELNLRLDTAQTGSATLSSSNPASAFNFSDSTGVARTTSSSAVEITPFSPDSIITKPNRVGNIMGNADHSATNVSFDTISAPRTRLAPLPPTSEKKESHSSWRSKLTGSSARKPSFVTPSGDTSSLSSTTLESQTLIEISLKTLVNLGTDRDKKKGAKSGSSKKQTVKSIHVYMSQNSPHALFWTQYSMHVWDLSNVGGAVPGTEGGANLVKSVAIESSCVVAAVTKAYLAYVVGSRDGKLTLRILSLLDPMTPAMEYRMPSTVWCRSIAICPSENYVVLGFENALVRFFSTTSSSHGITAESQSREDRLHRQAHKGECRECPAVDTLSFSADGLILLASTRNPKSGTIQIYQYRFPFHTFTELTSCRYSVPLHESEDAGISSAIARSAPTTEESLICISTWTQSGIPILIQPQDGHRVPITTSTSTSVSSDSYSLSSNSKKIGSRIQTAAFSPSGRDLALVNDRGHVYMVSRLNSQPMDVSRIATSRELTAKTDNFAMQFVATDEGEAVVLAWADAGKGAGWIKRVPTLGSGYTRDTATICSPTTLHVVSESANPQAVPNRFPAPKFELPAGDDDLDIASRRDSLATTSFAGQPQVHIQHAQNNYDYTSYAGYYEPRKFPIVDVRAAQTSELGGGEPGYREGLLPMPLRVPQSREWESEPEVKFLVEEKNLKVVEKSFGRGKGGRP